MARISRSRGLRFEHEVVATIRDWAIEAERRITQVRDGGHDVDSEVGRFECKYRRHLPEYLRPREDVLAVVCKEDRGQRLAVIRWADLLELLADRHKRLKARMHE